MHIGWAREKYTHNAQQNDDDDVDIVVVIVVDWLQQQQQKTGTLLIHFNLCTVHITSIVITQRLTAVMSDDEFFHRDGKCVWFKLGLYRTHYKQMSTHVKRGKHIYLLGDFIFRPWLPLIRFLNVNYKQQNTYAHQTLGHFVHNKHSKCV